MKDKIKSSIVLGGILIVIYVIFKLLSPDRFGSGSSMFILLQQSLSYAICSFGCYFIISMGVFDFSIGANIIMSALIGCQLSAKFGYVGLVLGCVLTGALIGALNGAIYIKFRIPSIIVTVGLAIIYECIAFILAGDEINRLMDEYKLFGRAPYNIILAAVAMAVAIYIITNTKIGIYIRAIGKNENMTANIGVSVDRIKFIAFVLCGMFTGIAAIITISRNASIVPVTGMASMSRNLQPFMGCFIGLAFRHYINPMISILVSEFMISMIVSGVITIGLDSTLQNCIIGGMLLIIVIIMASEQRKLREVVK